MKKTVVLLSGLFFFSAFSPRLYAQDNSKDLQALPNPFIEGTILSEQSPSLSEQSPSKTIVLQESKKANEDTQNQLDLLLQEFIIQMNEKAEQLAGVSDKVIDSAFDFYGVRYRFGGMSSSGIDCSGLVINAFSDTEVDLPRRSLDMAKVGQKVSKTQAQKGDLIFFKTRGARISHVGIITEVLEDEIKFIHSSTSKGVIVSSTKENYYRSRFVQINRVLEQNI